MEERVFNYKDLEKYTDNFNDVNKIGQGGYGDVYRGTVPENNPYNLPYREIAVKHIEYFDKKKVEQLDYEIQWLRRFQHEGIVEFLGVGESKKAKCIILKLEKKGNLADNIEDLSWTESLSILRQVASAISYVHSIDDGVVLGDVKLQNILLDQDNKPKLCDFGSTRVEGSKLAPYTAGIVDMLAMKRGEAMRGDDVQCFGVIMIQLLMKSSRAIVEIGDGIDENGNQSTDRIRFLALKKLQTENHVVHSKLLESGCSLKDAKTITDLAMELTWMPKADSPPKLIENIIDNVMRKARGELTDSTGEDDFPKIETQDEIELDTGEDDFAKIETEDEIELDTDEGETSEAKKEDPIVRRSIDSVMEILNSLNPPVDQQPPPTEEKQQQQQPPKKTMGFEMKKYAKVSKKAIGKAIDQVKNKYVKIAKYLKDGKLIKVLKKKMKKKKN